MRNYWRAKETRNSWVLGYARVKDVDYEEERKRKRKSGCVKLNTMYKCNSCNKVWEQYWNCNKNQFITYTDMPSYGLARNKCKQCKGENNG